MEKVEHALVPVPPPLVFLGFLVGALALNFALPVPVPWPSAARPLGALLVLCGLIIAWLAVRSMIRAHTSPDPGQPTAALVTTGPYRLTRNPIYLGFTLVYLGFTFLAGTSWGLILVPVLLFTMTRVIVRAEERYLLHRFQDQYRAYLSRVRQWI